MDDSKIADDISSLIRDISILSKQINNALDITKSVKEKTAVFQTDLGLPRGLVTPLYSSSLENASESIHDIQMKIDCAMERKDMMLACALQSMLIAKLYLTHNIDHNTVKAISVLADMYYARKLYSQASDHSSRLLQHISNLTGNTEMIELKIKSYFLIARGKISQQKFEKANNLLKMGKNLASNHGISSEALLRLHIRTRAELCDFQNLYLSAIELYSELIDRKLYLDDYDHVEILFRMNHLANLSGDLKKAIMYLEKANELSGSIKPFNILTKLKIKHKLITAYRKDDLKHACEMAQQILNNLPNMALKKEEKHMEIILRNQFVQLLMDELKYDQALMQQKLLSNLILESHGQDSIKFNLNQVRKAQILRLLGKQGASIALFRKIVHNKRFREHSRHPIFGKKVESLLDGYDAPVQAKLVSDYMDIKAMRIKSAKCA